MTLLKRLLGKIPSSDARTKWSKGPPSRAPRAVRLEPSLDEVAQLVAQEDIERLAKLAVYLRSIDPGRDPRGANARAVREAAIKGLLEIGQRREDPRVARALLAMPGGYGQHALGRLLHVDLSERGYAVPAKEREARLRPFLVDDATIRQRLRDLARYRRMDHVSATLRAADVQEAEEYAEQKGQMRDIYELTRALEGGNPELRAAAAAGLGRVGGPAAVGALRRAAASDKSAEVRRQATAALGDLGEVAEAADEANARRRRAAMHKVRSLIEHRVFQRWYANGHDERDARRHLISIGPDVAADLLDLRRTGMTRKYPIRGTVNLYIEVEVLHALGELGDERAVDHVIGVFDARLTTLEGQWHPQTVDPYSDYYVQVRREFEQAKWALEQIGGSKARQVLDKLRIRGEAQKRAQRRREMRSAGSKPPVSGSEVMKILGIPAGPIIGDALEYLTEAFRGEEAEPEVLRARLLAWAKERGVGRGA